MEGIRTHIRTYLEENPVPGLVSVYLFGSRAEDREHRESDLDIGVILDHDRYPERRDRFEVRVRLSSDLAGRYGGADVVILNDAPPLFARRIVTSGVRIHCEMPEKDHAFVRDVQLRAADLAPFIRRNRRRMLERLRSEH